MQDNDLYIVFNVEEDEIDTTFAYILKRANEYNYFNPRLINSEMFDLYEDIMAHYASIFNHKFNIDNVPGNMELFFNAEDYLDEETTYFIDGIFGEYMEVTMFLQTNNESATILLDNENSGNIILKIKDVQYDVDENIDNDSQSQTESSGIISDAVHAEELFNMYYSIMTIEQIKHPARYRDYQVQLSGLTSNDSLNVKKQVVLAIDIVMHSKSKEEKINWFDIHTFLYNLNGQSNKLLDSYLNDKKNNNYYKKYHSFERQAELNRMIDFIEKINNSGPSSSSPKFSLEEQWLLTFANQMKLLTLYESGGDD